MITLEHAFRSWPEGELRKAIADGLDPYASVAQRELERRERPCTCYTWGTVPHEQWRQAMRKCRRHEGRRP